MFQTHPPLRQRGKTIALGQREPRRRRFNPPPPCVSEGNGFKRPGGHLGGRVSTHPPLRQQGEPLASIRVVPYSFTFQPTPRLRASEGNGGGRTRPPGASGFNPPAVSSARGTLAAGRGPGGGGEFQPTPRLVQREGTSSSPCDTCTPWFSTHPPLRPRGGLRSRSSSGDGPPHVSTPPPRFVSKGNPSPSGSATAAAGFNPPPAWSARGTRLRLTRAADCEFQPTPRFVSEGEPAGLLPSGRPWSCL